MKIREDVLISSLTTMRLGGLARYVIEVESPDDVKEAYDFAEKHNSPTWIMGGGANTIGHDETYDGAIILNRITGIEITKQTEDELILTGKGGEDWDKFVEYSCELGYSGIEAMSLIPGTVGAAPVQNIGAYGQEIAQVITHVEAYDTHENKFVKIEKADMKLGYRQTRFNTGEDKGRFLITSATVRLSKEYLQPPFYNSLQKYLDENKIDDYSPKSIRKAVCTIRQNKLPDPAKVASAGSFFKNVLVKASEVPIMQAKGIPVRVSKSGCGKVNSGWLIEQCGLSGKELYGFKVSEEAALVLINESARSYSDLAKARAEIVNAVKAKFGVTLEQEPVEIPRV